MIYKSRAAFEATFTDELHTREMWECWQASQEVALDECAKRADACAYMSQNFTALADEFRRMK